jgi:hypothetical protein
MLQNGNASERCHPHSLFFFLAGIAIFVFVLKHSKLLSLSKKKTADQAATKVPSMALSLLCDNQVDKSNLSP